MCPMDNITWKVFLRSRVIFATKHSHNRLIIHSFIPDISITTFQIHYYSEANPGYSIDTVSELTRRCATGNYE